jgi:glucose/arabinose dehydrogenase
MSKMILLFMALLVSGCYEQAATDGPQAELQNKTNQSAINPSKSMPYKQTVLATGLDVPWELVVSPDGRLFVTERSGALRVIEKGKLLDEPMMSLDKDLYKKSEAGLLGLALDPDFAENHAFYVYQSYVDAEGQSKNRVLRLIEHEKNKAKLDKVLLDGLPASQIHDGGRLKFGPDGMLYLTNGDSSSPSHAQDLKKFSGKIFRLQRDGAIPPDNPFPGSPVYSLGHRNPQGLAWHPLTGKLYSAEHGQSAHDEINLIVAGANFGWPLIQGDDKEIKQEDVAKKGPGPIKPPILHSGDETWAPSGITFVSRGPWKGNLLVANLRGTQILRVVLTPSGESVQSAEPLFKNEFGRIRDVVEGSDGSLYILTNNRDGRGSPGKDDDRIIKLSPDF